MTKGSTPGSRSEGGNGGFSCFSSSIFPFFWLRCGKFSGCVVSKNQFFATARCGVQMKYSRRKFTATSEDVHAQSHIRATSESHLWCCNMHIRPGLLLKVPYSSTQSPPLGNPKMITLQLETPKSCPQFTWNLILVLWNTKIRPNCFISGQKWYHTAETLQLATRKSIPRVT